MTWHNFDTGGVLVCASVKLQNELLVKECGWEETEGSEEGQMGWFLSPSTHHATMHFGESSSPAVCEVWWSVYECSVCTCEGDGISSTAHSKFMLNLQANLHNFLITSNVVDMLSFLMSNFCFFTKELQKFKAHPLASFKLHAYISHHTDLNHFMCTCLWQYGVQSKNGQKNNQKSMCCDYLSATLASKLQWETV